METFREMTSKVAEYFPHDYNAGDDPKVMLMMAQLGLEAYGIYWILVEYLRQQPGYTAPLNLLDALSRRYGSSKEKFETVITKFQLFEYNDTSFWSPSLIRRMEQLEKKRQANRENILKRWGKDTTVLPPYYDGNTEESRVEKSRVEKSRVKKSKGEKSKGEISLSDTSYVDDLFASAWMKWFSYKIELGDPYKTVSGAKTQYNHLVSLSGGDPGRAMKIVDQSIAQEWKGLFALKDKSLSKSVPGESAIQKMMREMEELEKLEEHGNK